MSTNTSTSLPVAAVDRASLVAPEVRLSGPPPASGRLAGVAILLVVTLIWGTTFILTRWLETDRSAPLAPGTLILLRFILAAFICTPGLLAAGRKPALWAAGLELGFWLWCGYISQAVGLTSTTVGRSSFITSLNVIFVPALAALGGRRVSPRVWAAAVLALVGTSLLCNDGMRPNAGDAWTLVTAATYAVYIIRLESYTPRFASIPLTSVQLWGVVLFSSIWIGAGFVPSLGSGHVTAHVVVNRLIPSTRSAWIQVVYLGIVATALTTWLQTIGQRTVSGPQASLLYTLEPVWASFFAWIGSGEGLGQAGWFGATLILAAAIGSRWPLPPRKSAKRIAE